MEHAAGRTAASMAATGHELGALRWDWGEAYEIEHGDEYGWRAKRLDGLGGWLTAAGPDELYGVIAADYNAKPVPRSATLADGS
jgi:hypothetical protein